MTTLAHTLPTTQTISLSAFAHRVRRKAASCARAFVFFMGSTGTAISPGEFAFLDANCRA